MKTEYEKRDQAWKKIIHYDLEGHYLCNRKCNTFPEKRTLDKNKVTCRPCLLRLRMNEERNQEIIKVDGDYEIREDGRKNNPGYNCRKNKNPISKEDMDLLRRKISVTKLL